MKNIKNSPDKKTENTLSEIQKNLPEFEEKIIFASTIDVPNFNLERSLSCGQAFRWNNVKEDIWFGVAKNKGVFLKQKDDKLFLSCEKAQIAFWVDYLAVNTDYSEMEKMLLSNPKTAPSLDYSRGIRVFHQDVFETIISFIISANNNVKRISGIIEKLSEALGEKKTVCGKTFFAFPTPKALASATEEFVKSCGAGYRAPYIISTAKTIAEAEFDIESLKELDFESAKKQLLKLSGVGPKVAQCIMLFSLNFDCAFPVDVWVKRICELLFDFDQTQDSATLTAQYFGNYAGAAQQYLFHYARQIGLGKEK